jgi:hypothetical protein
MINSRPNNSSYKSGNFIPMNKHKVLKLNKEGGVYFRSSWENRIMIWLDNNESIKMWGAECLKIPYQMTHFKSGDLEIRDHNYYPDFYYEMLNQDGSIKRVVVEVKPHKEYQMVLDLNEGKLNVPQNGLKKLKSFEYDLKMAQRNRDKWETMIKWCNKKGYEFIIITEHHLKKFGI